MTDTPHPEAVYLYDSTRPYAEWITTKHGVTMFSMVDGKVDVTEYPFPQPPPVTDPREPRLFHVWGIKDVPSILSPEWWPAGAESLMGSFRETPAAAELIFEKYKSAYAEPYDEVSDLLGKTLAGCWQEDDVAIHFILPDGRDLKLWHKRQCCESVTIEDVNGDLNNLVGSPLTLAEESTSDEHPAGVDMGDYESFTWTFYRFATAKGFVDIRWFGESNGAYSEAVHFSDNIPGIGD